MYFFWFLKFNKIIIIEKIIMMMLMMMMMMMMMIINGATLTEPLGSDKRQFATLTPA